MSSPAPKKTLGQRLKSFRLPKVSRARGRSRNRRNKKGKKDVEVAPVRVAAPKPSEKVEEILSADSGYVLWLGDDYTKAVKASYSGEDDAKLSDTLLGDALKAVAELVADEEKKAEILAILTDTKPEAKETALQDAKTGLVELLGSAAFNTSLSQYLTAKWASFYGTEPDVNIDTLYLKLIKALRPSLIVYTGTDRVLETQIQHDNVATQSITPRDLLSESSLAGVGAEAAVDSLLAKSGVNKKVLLKINGDVSKPESLSFTGSKLEEDSDDGKFAAELVKVIVEKLPVIFVGNTFLDGTPLVSTIQGEEKEVKHSALITAATEDQNIPDSSATGVEYLTYTADESYTQILEFLASMVSISSKEIAAELTPQAVEHKGFVFGQAMNEYLGGIVQKEKEANVINVYTSDLTSLSFVVCEKFTEQVVIPEVKERTPDEKLVETIMTTLTDRENTLVAKVTEGSITETVFRVIVPKDAANVPNSEANVAKIEKIIEMLEQAKGRVELRFTDSAPGYAGDFEVLFFDGEKGVGDICLLTESDRPFFNISWFDQNTNEAEEKVLLFERLWNAAMTAPDSFEFLKAALETVKNTPVIEKIEESTEKKKKRRRWFSKPRTEKPKSEVKRKTKNASKNASVEKEEEPKAEEKAEEPKAEEKAEEPKAEEKAEEPKADEAVPPAPPPVEEKTEAAEEKEVAAEEPKAAAKTEEEGEAEDKAEDKEEAAEKDEKEEKSSKADTKAAKRPNVIKRAINALTLSRKKNKKLTPIVPEEVEGEAAAEEKEEEKKEEEAAPAAEEAKKEEAPAAEEEKKEEAPKEEDKAEKKEEAKKE